VPLSKTTFSPRYAITAAEVTHCHNFTLGSGAGNRVGGVTPSPPPNVCKVFILLGLSLDLQFWVDGKVLILLGFAVGDVDKVFISNK
jgi:hypothetical protein